MMNATTTELGASAPPRGADESPLHADLFEALDRRVSRLWAEAKAGSFWRQVLARGFNRALYRRLMSQVFHYTRHNAINQAAAALRIEPGDLKLLKFVCDHAREELGHENLAAHDLASAGICQGPDSIEPALPATDALIGYLYGVALREGPVARLGYSYWAETAYDHIGPLVAAARTSLALSDRQLTFFVAHAAIDEKHSQDVRAVIRHAVRTPEQADAVLRVATTTLWLTTQMMEQALAGSVPVEGDAP
jgi:hypothetical protein